MPAIERSRVVRVLSENRLKSSNSFTHSDGYEDDNNDGYEDDCPPLEHTPQLALEVFGDRCAMVPSSHFQSWFGNRDWSLMLTSGFDSYSRRNNQFRSVVHLSCRAMSVIICSKTLRIMGDQLRAVWRKMMNAGAGQDALTIGALVQANDVVPAVCDSASCCFVSSRLPNQYTPQLALDVFGDRCAMVPSSHFQSWFGNRDWSLMLMSGFDSYSRRNNQFRSVVHLSCRAMSVIICSKTLRIMGDQLRAVWRKMMNAGAGQDALTIGALVQANSTSSCSSRTAGACSDDKTDDSVLPLLTCAEKKSMMLVLSTRDAYQRPHGRFALRAWRYSSKGSKFVGDESDDDSDDDSDTDEEIVMMPPRTELERVHDVESQDRQLKLRLCPKKCIYSGKRRCLKCRSIQRAQKLALKVVEHYQQLWKLSYRYLHRGEQLQLELLHCSVAECGKNSACSGCGYYRSLQYQNNCGWEIERELSWKRLELIELESVLEESLEECSVCHKDNVTQQTKCNSCCEIRKQLDTMDRNRRVELVSHNSKNSRQQEYAVYVATLLKEIKLCQQCDEGNRCQTCKCFFSELDFVDKQNVVSTREEARLLNVERQLRWSQEHAEAAAETQKTLDTIAAKRQSVRDQMAGLPCLSPMDVKKYIDQYGYVRWGGVTQMNLQMTSKYSWWEPVCQDLIFYPHKIVDGSVSFQSVYIVVDADDHIQSVPELKDRLISASNYVMPCEYQKAFLSKDIHRYDDCALGRYDHMMCELSLIFDKHKGPAGEYVMVMTNNSRDMTFTLCGANGRSRTDLIAVHRQDGDCSFKKVLGGCVDPLDHHRYRDPQNLSDILIFSKGSFAWPDSPRSILHHDTEVTFSMSKLYNSKLTREEDEWLLQRRTLYFSFANIPGSTVPISRPCKLPLTWFPTHLELRTFCVLQEEYQVHKPSQEHNYQSARHYVEGAPAPLPYNSMYSGPTRDIMYPHHKHDRVFHRSVSLYVRDCSTASYFVALQSNGYNFWRGGDGHGATITDDFSLEDEQWPLQGDYLCRIFLESVKGVRRTYIQDLSHNTCYAAQLTNPARTVDMPLSYGLTCNALCRNKLPKCSTCTLEVFPGDQGSVRFYSSLDVRRKPPSDIVRRDVDMTIRLYSIKLNNNLGNLTEASTAEDWIRYRCVQNRINRKRCFDEIALEQEFEDCAARCLNSLTHSYKIKKLKHLVQVLNMDQKLSVLNSRSVPHFTLSRETERVLMFSEGQRKLDAISKEHEELRKKHQEERDEVESDSNCYAFLHSVNSGQLMFRLHVAKDHHTLVSGKTNYSDWIGTDSAIGLVDTDVLAARQCCISCKPKKNTDGVYERNSAYLSYSGQELSYVYKTTIHRIVGLKLKEIVTLCCEKNTVSNGVHLLEGDLLTFTKNGSFTELVLKFSFNQVWKEKVKSNALKKGVENVTGEMVEEESLYENCLGNEVREVNVLNIHDEAANSSYAYDDMNNEVNESDLVFDYMDV